MLENYKDALNSLNYYKGTSANKKEAFQDPTIVDG